MDSLYHHFSYLLNEDISSTGFEVDESIDFNEIGKSILSVLRTMPGSAPEVEGDATSGKIVYKVDKLEGLSDKATLTISFQSSTNKISFSFSGGPNSGRTCQSFLANILKDAQIDINAKKIKVQDSSASIAIPGTDDEIDAVFGN